MEIFCREVLNADLPPEPPGRRTYELNGLKSRDFAFPTDPDDGIAEVRVRKLRVAFVDGRPGRLTFEADPKGGRDDVYDLMERVLDPKAFPRSGYNVTQATLQFRFAKGAGRSRSMTFDVSYPDSSNLKSLRDELRVLGEKYLRAWGIERD